MDAKDGAAVGRALVDMRTDAVITDAALRTATAVADSTVVRHSTEEAKSTVAAASMSEAVSTEAVATADADNEKISPSVIAAGSKLAAGLLFWRISFQPCTRPPHSC